MYDCFCIYSVYHIALVTPIIVVKVKVSHSLLAVGAVGVSQTVSWAQLMKGGAHPSLLLPYPSLIRKRYPFTAGLTETVFQLPHGATEPRTHVIRRLSTL